MGWTLGSSSANWNSTALSLFRGFPSCGHPFLLSSGPFLRRLCSCSWSPMDSGGTSRCSWTTCCPSPVSRCWGRAKREGSWVPGRACVFAFLHPDRLLSLGASATCLWSRRKLCLRSSATKTLQGCSWGNMTSSCLCVSTSSAQSLPPAHGMGVLWTDCVSPKFILKP